MNAARGFLLLRVLVCTFGPPLIVGQQLGAALGFAVFLLEMFVLTAIQAYEDGTAAKMTTKPEDKRP